MLKEKEKKIQQLEKRINDITEESEILERKIKTYEQYCNVINTDRHRLIRALDKASPIIEEMFNIWNNKTRKTKRR